jgi:glycerol-3-phosphate dehydrogenase
VKGAVGRDALSGREVHLRARVVINAAGPAAGAVLAGAGLCRPPVPHLEAANLVLRRRLTDVALGGRVEGRYLFLVPWRDRSLAGTAYAPEGTPREVLVRALLDDARRAFPWAGIAGSDVTLVHHGRVPGRGGASGLWSRSRVVDHEREDGLAGLLTLVGVKFTTARATAEAAVGLAAARAGRPARPSRTAVTPLPGARLLEGPLEDQVRQAVRDEMAVTLQDALLRRLDLGTAGPVAPEALDAAAAAMARETGWDEGRARAERDGVQSLAM